MERDLFNLNLSLKILLNRCFFIWGILLLALIKRKSKEYERETKKLELNLKLNKNTNINKTRIYSQTCVQRPPSRPKICGRC